MGRLLICDWCGNKMFTFYKDKMYKITVKQLTHAYDGYNPWVKKQRMDICMDCRNEIAMTGQEWFTAFERELSGLRGVVAEDEFEDILEAAKRASGVDK